MSREAPIRTLRRAFAATSIAGFLVVATDCASIVTLPPIVVDRPVRDSIVEVPRGSDAHVTVEQTGMVVTLTAKQACDVYDRPIVDRTTTTKSTNNSPWVDWTFGIGGVGLIGGGVATFLDAGKVYGTDTTSRTYNPIGPTGAKIVGVAEVAGGLTAGIVALIDVARAGHTVVDEHQVTTAGTMTRSDISCTGVPSVGLVVTATVLDKTLILGLTDRLGVLRFDLDASFDMVFNSTFALPTPLPQLTLAGAFTVTGDIDLTPLAVVREKRAWAKVDVASCLTPRTAKACDDVQKFADSYPKGAHAGEARKALSDTAAVRAKLADDEAWAGLAPKYADCVSTTIEAPHLILGPCKALREYAAAFPAGAHVDAALVAAKRGEARAAVLADEADWADVEDARKACASTSSMDRVDISQGCLAVLHYIATYPKGLHIVEATAIVKRGKARVAVLEEEADRKEKAAAAVEQRKAKEEARKVKAAEAAAKQCPHMCDLQCLGEVDNACRNNCEYLECDLAAGDQVKVQCMRGCTAICSGGYGDGPCIKRCVSTRCGVYP